MNTQIVFSLWQLFGFSLSLSLPLEVTRSIIDDPSSNIISSCYLHHHYGTTAIVIPRTTLQSSRTATRKETFRGALLVDTLICFTIYGLQCIFPRRFLSSFFSIFFTSGSSIGQVIVPNFNPITF